ncbi:MAG: hypothetical protein JXR83_13795, partial [Deltaproteobacteria bacterium]|nr:hypothetical protein [Deltaproteobacteria bacterium]
IEQGNKQYARAQELLKKGNFNEARHALDGVPEGSTRAKDAADLRKAIDRAEVDHLVARGRAELKAGRLDQAEPLAEKALVLDGNHAGARALQQEIEKAKAAALVPVPPAEPEKKVEPEKPQEPAPRKHTGRTKKKKSRTVREPRPAPEPRGLSESEAEQLYRDGLDAYKADQLDKSKRIMQKIIKQAPAGSAFREKAKSFIERRLQ